MLVPPYTRGSAPISRGQGESLVPLYTRVSLSLSQGPGRMPSASLYTPKRISASHFMCCNLTGMRVDDMASIIYQALPQSALQPKRPKAGVSYGG